MNGLFIAGIVFIIGILMMFMAISMKNNQNEGEKWIQEIYKEKNINDDTIEFLLSNSSYNNFLIYTKDNRLYVANKNIQVIDKINLLDILKIDVETYISEKNVKRLVSITSTFDKKIKITGIDFKITTRKSVFVIPCMINERSSNGSLIIDVKAFLDDVNRCKLIIEKDIEKINNVNI